MELLCDVVVPPMLEVVLLALDPRAALLLWCVPLLLPPALSPPREWEPPKLFLPCPKRVPCLGGADASGLVAASETTNFRDLLCGV